MRKEEKDEEKCEKKTMKKKQTYKVEDDGQ